MSRVFQLAGRPSGFSGPEEKKFKFHLSLILKEIEPILQKKPLSDNAETESACDIETISDKSEKILKEMGGV